jgi:16S rRNA (uracil1498-N3)-methyltransferase
MIAKLAAATGEIKLRIHRLHTTQALEPGAEVRLEEQASHYLGRVLRAAAGQRVVLFNGDGHDYAAEILSPARSGMILRIESRLPGLPEPPLAVTVVQALSRGDRMDQTLQKCTELGAAGFRLLQTERVELRLRGDKLEKRLAHWRGVIVSACEQCGRARVPALEPPVSLPEWLQLAGETTRLVLDAGADRTLASAVPEGLSWVEVAVGPEGGFSEQELRQMKGAGALAVAIGPRVLRTETAAPAAVAVLQAQWGDLR